MTAAAELVLKVVVAEAEVEDKTVVVTAATRYAWEAKGVVSTTRRRWSTE